MTSAHSDFPPTAGDSPGWSSDDNSDWGTTDGWGSDDGSDTTSGRRRRARGEKAFERDSDAGVADREDVVAVPVAPVSRLVSLAVAIFAGLLGLALIFGAYTEHRPYGLVIFGVQVLFVLSWTIATRPPGPRVVAAVGLGAAAVVDIAVAWPEHATIAPIGYVTAAAFAAGAVGQLLRKGGRDHVLESLAATLMMVVGVVAYATLIVLTRHSLGTEALAACLAGAGVGIVVARLVDVVLPFPRTTPQVARGTIGILAGVCAGTVASALVAAQLKGLHPRDAVLAGLIVSVAAVLADLGVGYAEASREIDGEVSQFWVVRHMQGPLGAFALAAPVAYAMSVMILVSSL
ncbi:MAG TPA: hypothetical protein VGJ28_07855 [Micromonosporaceae bacterium]